MARRFKSGRRRFKFRRPNFRRFRNFVGRTFRRRRRRSSGGGSLLRRKVRLPIIGRVGLPLILLALVVIFVKPVREAVTNIFKK